MNKIFNFSALDTLNDRKTKFEIFDAALGTTLFIVFSIIFTCILKYGKISIVSGTVGYFVLQAFAELVFAVAAVVLVWYRKYNLVEDCGMKQKVSWRLVGWCFLASLVSLFGFGSLTNVFLSILEYFGYKSILGDISISTFAQYIGYVISSCAIAAFCEELLFRGVILSGFRKFGITVAVGFSALIFMLMHGNAEQTVHQFIIGIIVGYVFYKTKNLWIGVLIHAFNNFIPITEAYILSSSSETAETVEETASKVGFSSILVNAILAIIVAYFGLFFLKMILKQIFKENEKLNGEKKTNDGVTSIVVDGDEKDVEMSIDGAPVENVADETISIEKEEKPNISSGTIILFILSGLYLVGEWLLVAAYGFM